LKLPTCSAFTSELNNKDYNGHNSFLIERIENAGASASTNLDFVPSQTFCSTERTAADLQKNHSRNFACA
jgi:hypothetical protein